MSDSSQRADVIVIGLGIVGASTAYSCAQSNLSTIVLEQYDTHAHANGGSFGTSRCWRTAYANPCYAKMMINSLKIWQHLEKKMNIKLLTHCGGLDFGPPHSSALKNVIVTMKSLRQRYEILTAQQAMQRFYPISLPSTYAAVYTPDHYGTIHVSRALNCMVQSAMDFGCRIEYNQKVTQVARVKLRSAKRVTYQVRTDKQQTFECEHVVFCGGAYTLPPIVSSKSQNLQRKVAYVANQCLKPTAFSIVFYRQLSSKGNQHGGKQWMTENWPVWAEYGAQNVCDWYGMITPRTTPFGDIYCHKIGDSAASVTDWEDEKDDFAHIRDYVQRRFKDSNVKMMECKKCYVMETKDDDFIIDRLHENENIYLAFGSHTFKVAPEIGQMVKRLIIDRSYHAPAMFRLQRFIKDSKL